MASLAGVVDGVLLAAGLVVSLAGVVDGVVLAARVEDGMLLVPKKSWPVRFKQRSMIPCKSTKLSPSESALCFRSAIAAGDASSTPPFSRSYVSMARLRISSDMGLVRFPLRISCEEDTCWHTSVQFT